MGLTVNSVGKKAVKTAAKLPQSDFTVLLAGCPNVGKSTVFNALTGLKQHTGNWSGKTVTNSVGYYTHKDKKTAIIDLPGTYTLFPHSQEESVAREAICFENAQVTVVVCDATTLQKCLVLVLQVLEITRNCILCVNLIDEAKKKGIVIDKEVLCKLLDIPVVLTNAREKEGLDELRDEIHRMAQQKRPYKPGVLYSAATEEAISTVRAEKFQADRFCALRLLCNDTDFKRGLKEHTGITVESDETLCATLKKAKKILLENGITVDKLRDEVSAKAAQCAADISTKVLKKSQRDDHLDRKLDRFFTGRLTAVPVMLLMMAVVFFITIYAANYPSQLLSAALFSLGDAIRRFLLSIGTPALVCSALTDGVWRVMAWVVSVMLPPMAIFFPLFTLLEDFGYLPRMAFNLDCCFKKCNACGKQSLCMAMGFGCNAAGVVGCRIIDSKRERLIAILTNSLVPCNGRFPTIIAVISMFFVSALSPAFQAAGAAAILSLVILVSIFVSLFASWLLSKTILKGESSSFTLELPSFRVPKIGSVIVRSVFDRTLFVLGRAVCVSAPMGLVIWLLANIHIGDMAVISYISSFLDPIGRFLGLDGVILLAFILGFPANEIVLPIVLMCYLSQGVLVEVGDYASIYAVLSQSGWTAVTGICFIIFSLFHFPCSTTLMTIKKETGSLKYTAASFLLPTAIGTLLCMCVHFISQVL